MHATLLRSHELSWILFAIFKESRFVPERPRGEQIARRQAEARYLTAAAIVRLIARKNRGSSAPDRRESVQAARYVAAAICFGLVELDQPRNRRDVPIAGTERLAKFVFELDRAFRQAYTDICGGPELREGRA